MYYRFIVECWTNRPDEAQSRLEKALAQHKPLKESGLAVTGRDLAVRLDPAEVGKSPLGDPWRFFVEGETRSPDWTQGEIRMAIRNHRPAAQLAFAVLGSMLMASPEKAQPTADEAERWLRHKRPRDR